MNFLGLVRRGLGHYHRTHLGVVAGAMIATATLVGALVVGDSVRHSLMRGALERIGGVASAMSSNDRFFRAALADTLELAGAPAVAVTGVASTSDGARRLHDVQVLGVDERFFQLAPGRSGNPEASRTLPPEPGEAWVNAATARRLALTAGDEVVVRVELPSALPRDMALAPGDVGVALRLRIAGVLPAAAFGEFSLRGGTTPRANVLVDLDWIQQQLELGRRANLLLTDSADVEALNTGLARRWELADAQLELTGLEDGRRELRTDRIFFDEPLLRALEAEQGTPLEGVFTYFVNALRAGDRETPYSMVAALGPLNEAARAEPPHPNPARESELVRGLGADTLALGAWAADDLGLTPGASVELDYYVVDASRRLVERSASFRLERVVPLAGAALDASLMPDFPGLAGAEHCRDWEPGTPVDLERIRDVDEEYWDLYGGTPKAFLTLEAGRRLWSSRFGALTAVRFPADGEQLVRAALREGVAPAELGLYFVDVRGPALAGGDSATDFGGLFLGLSFFLIVSALLLMSQLFLFGIEQRAREIGLYGAVGLPRGFVRRLLLTEALLLSVVGAGLGVLLGQGYTKLVLLGLTSVWSDAVASTQLDFHARPATLVLGFALSVLAGLGTAWLTLRKVLGTQTVRLLGSAAGVELVTPASARSRRGPVVSGVCFVLAFALVFAVDPGRGPAAAGAFFGAGALVLLGALVACNESLRRAPARRELAGRGLASLGRENGRRRPSRSLATIALTAIGTFLVVAVGANRLGPTQDTGRRDSGTGGFALFGRSSLPVVHDLNDPAGRAALGIDEDELAGVSVVPMRLLQGDDASCLNLARPQAPPLFGVASAQLAERGAFEFAETITPTEEPWSLLAAPPEQWEDGAVPAIGDATSLTWQLHLGVGDTLDYVGERGESFRVRIVGTVADSVLQGALVIEEARFEERFPTQGGHRRFLIDAPPERADDVSELLTRRLRDVGLALETTAQRLDRFHSVQNSYLSIFQALGGLGLLLGSVGLGALLLRNTLERRAELALLSALGYRTGRIRSWVLSEYGSLLLLGLGAGALAALVAVVPTMRAPGSDLSLTSFWIVCAALAISGLFWLQVAVRFAVQRAPLAALSEE